MPDHDSPSGRGRDRAAADRSEPRDSVLHLLLQDTLDIDRLGPRTADRETFDQVLAAIHEARAREESIAQLRARLAPLGDAGVACVDDIVRLGG